MRFLVISDILMEMFQKRAFDFHRGSASLARRSGKCDMAWSQMGPKIPGSTESEVNVFSL